MQSQYVRLPLHHAYNVRDLGGYACCGGEVVTKWNRFLRTDTLAKLDDYDIGFLLDYGVTSVVDLRSPEEISENPNVLSNHPDINYINVNFMNGSVADLTRAGITSPAEFIPQFYLNLIKKCRREIKNIFNFFAENEGCTIFHCTVGKDRTGITAALLLGLVDVARADIIANYSVTYTYILQNPHVMAMSEAAPSETLLSLPNYIIPTLDYIEENYGETRIFLRDCGITDDVLDKVAARLIV